MRILFCESSKNWGGQELLACRQIAWLRQRGHVADLACDRDSQVLPRARELGLAPLALPFHAARPAWTAARLGWASLTRRYQLLSCYGYQDHQACLPLFRLGLKVVRSRHISHPVRTEAELFHNGCHHVVCVSRNVQQDLCDAGVAAEKITVIPNGIDLADYRNAKPAGWREKLRLAPDDLLVGNLGMFRFDKGQDLFVAAAAAVHRRHPRVHFYLAGEDVRDGTMGAALRAQAAREGLEKKLHFLGYVQDTAALLQETDAVVIASRATESSPLVLREALAAGVPLLATALGDVPDFLEHRRTGLVVPPGDVAALTQALEELVTNAPLRQELGRQGMALANSAFDFDRTMEQFAAVFEKVLRS